MHNSKTCFKCNIHQPLSEFYKHKEMADGHLNKCKKCTKSDVSKNRTDNIDYYLEYDRARGMREDRVSARAEYAKTEAGIIVGNRAKVKWQSENTLKVYAHRIYTSFIKKNKDKKKDFCENCFAKGVRINAHHDDYAKPLDVRYLCSKCHTKWHKENGEGING